MRRIGILTGGGDAPGLNAVIRAAVKTASNEYRCEVIGIEDGYHGVIHNRCRKLEYNDVSGILTLGGTILGTSKSANPYRYAIKKGNKLEFKDMSKTAVANIKKLDIDAADPAFAPGTGTPEVGGLTSHQLLQLVRGLRGLDLAGFDLVEVCPPYDHGDITAILAANLAFEYLSLIALRRTQS